MANLPPNRIRRWLVALGLIVAVYALLGFFLVPVIVRRQIANSGSAALNRPVTVEHAGFNPFTFVVSVDQLRVGDPGGERPLFSLEHGRFNFDAFESLLRWQWRFGDVALAAPRVRLVVTERGELNIADLFGGRPADSSDRGGARIGVDTLTVEEGSVAYEDRSGGSVFARAIEPIAFTLEDFSTEPGRGGAYRLSGQTEAGEKLTWNGRISVAPFASSGRVEFAALNLPSYRPLLGDLLGGDIRSGRLDLAANYEFAMGTERVMRLRDVTLRGTDAAVGWPNAQEPAIAVATVTATAPEVDLLGRRARVAEVTVDGLALRVNREIDGSIDLRRLWRGQEPNPADSDAGHADVQIDRMALQNGRVQFTDRSTPEPAELSADEIALTLTRVGTDPQAESGVDLTLRWLDGPGMLKAKGTLRREPLRADLQVNGTQLALAPLTPYLQSLTRAAIGEGSGELEGRLQVDRTESAPLAVRWSGRTAVNGLVVRDTASGEDVVRWNELAINDGEFGSSPSRMTAREIKLDAPVLNIVRDAEGATNLSSLLGAGKETQAEAGAAEAPAGETPAKAPPPAIEIENLSISGGTASFTDQSVEPAAEAKITAIAGSFRGLSTERGEAGRLDLTASVFGSAQAKVEGTVNLVGNDAISGSNVALDVKSVELEPFEPYVVRFLGHRVQQGAIRGDFAYRVSAGALDGKNHIVLDDFFLGEPVDSPEALHVPVKLALAVLRNPNGQIVLDVPVGGSLKSPDFDFTQAIRGAFGNILGRVATAPFALLGSMFGAPDAELDRVEFPAARAEFSEEAQRKLDVLARALQERPTLKLVIHWRPSPEADREALLQQRLDELLQQQRAQLAEDVGDGVTEQQVLRSLYADRVLGLNAGQISEGGARAAEPGEKTERRAWYARFWHWFWGPWPEHDRPPPSAAVQPEPPQISEAQMREEVLQTIKLAPDAFATVARDRANAVRDRLLGAGVRPERVVVDAAAAPESEAAAEGPRVSFTLEEMSKPATNRPESSGQGPSE